MDNKIYLYPNECSQNTTPLMEISPENGAYQSQSPETIPVGSSDYPSYQEYDTNPNNNYMNEIKIKEQDYENFKNKAIINKYHVKQPTKNTFHISTGEYLSLFFFILFVIILLITLDVLAVVGIIEIEGENAIGIILSPCIIMALIGFCCNHFCCTYNNADIIMSDNSLIIKRRSCVWQSTKIYYPGQIHEMELYMYDRENRKYKLELILSNNKRKTLLVINEVLTSDEISYFLEVVNSHIKNKMKV